MAEIRFEGAEKLAVVGKQLKDIGDKELRKELLAGLRKAAAPLTVKAQESAAARLPKKGGLNEVVAGAKFAVSTSTGGNPRVRIVAKLGRSNLRLLDRGEIRHPVFGNRDVWVTTKVAPGWFSVPMAAAADPVRTELVSVIDSIKAKVK